MHTYEETIYFCQDLMIALEDGPQSPVVAGQIDLLCQILDFACLESDEEGDPPCKT